MKQSKKKTPIVFYIGMALLCLTMISIHFSAGMYARYVTTDHAQDEARVAKFDVKQSGTMTQSLHKTMRPGDSFTKEIEITNDGEAYVSCVVRVETTGNLPLDYSWTEQTVSLAPGDTETLSLTIEWSGTNHNYLYSQELDELSIVVDCTQID